MLILLFFVFSLNDDEFIVGLNGNFIGCELLNVKNHLKFILLNVDGRSGVLTAQVDIVWSVIGWSRAGWDVSVGQRAQQVIFPQRRSEMLIDQSRSSRATERVPIRVPVRVIFIPPISESQWHVRHFFNKLGRTFWFQRFTHDCVFKFTSNFNGGLWKTEQFFSISTLF